jgi:acyl-CoA synthetase
VGTGRPAGRGPATCLGYFDDDAANGELFTDDGWMLMGDVVEIDGDGYVRVIGRTSDFVIRGGKNISAPAVEEEVVTHPAVAVAAVVAMPDPIFGERVCVYVELRPGGALTLEELVAHLDARGVSKEWFPEHLVVLGELPRSSGGKVAKGELRDDARRRAQPSSVGAEVPPMTRTTAPTPGDQPPNP